MGIQVGEKNPRHIKSEEIGQHYRQAMNSKADAAAAAAEEQKRLDEAKNQAQNRITPKTIEEEKAALSHDNDLLTRIMAMPKAEQPQALREAGYPLLADQKAKEVAEEAEREQKLSAIMAMPETDRIGALLDAGFTEEAAAENKRMGLARNWSAIITLLNDLSYISIADENTHAVLEQASGMDDNDSRIAYVKENGLEIVGTTFEAIVNGAAFADIEKELKEKKAAETAATKPEDGAGAGVADTAPAPAEEADGGDAAPEPESEGEKADASGDADAAGEGAGEAAPAAEEKKKPGRPAGSTKK